MNPKHSFSQKAHKILGVWGLVPNLKKCEAHQKKIFMKNNPTKEEYDRAKRTLDEIKDLVFDSMPEEDPLVQEFLKVMRIIETYEKIHSQIKPTS